MNVLTPDRTPTGMTPELVRFGQPSSPDSDPEARRQALRAQALVKIQRILRPGAAAADVSPLIISANEVRAQREGNSRARVVQEARVNAVGNSKEAPKLSLAEKMTMWMKMLEQKQRRLKEVGTRMTASVQTAFSFMTGNGPRAITGPA